MKFNASSPHILLVILLLPWSVGCSPKEKAAADTTSAAQNPIEVSQKSISDSMLQRIENDGNSVCANENGLKAIEWAYDTLPGGYILGSTDNLPTVAYDDLPKQHIARLFGKDVYELARRMSGLADKAPTAFRLHAYPTSYNDGESAKYVCTSGAVFDSENFTFVP